MLSRRQWAEINGIGLRTADRILASGDGPVVTQLTDRRIGIREDHNAAWQAARIRGGK
jgi:predicted site-specific integrase-resolvase